MQNRTALFHGYETKSGYGASETLYENDGRSESGFYKFEFYISAITFYLISFQHTSLSAYFSSLTPMMNRNYRIIHNYPIILIRIGIIRIGVGRVRIRPFTIIFFFRHVLNYKMYKGGICPEKKLVSMLNVDFVEFPLLSYFCVRCLISNSCWERL